MVILYFILLKYFFYFITSIKFFTNFHKFYFQISSLLSSNTLKETIQILPSNLSKFIHSLSLNPSSQKNAP